MGEECGTFGTVRSECQLPAGLLASFPCKLNTFRKRVKNVVTSKGIEVGIECK
jgi:arginine decarboxylase-like protein